MRQNYLLSVDNLKNAEGLIIPCLSGLMTGVAADADVCGIVNLDPRPVIVSQMRVRWVTKTAFTAAQAMAFRANKVYAFTTGHTTGGKTVQAHYRHQSGITGTAIGERIPLAQIYSYISTTGAITGGVYTGEDTDEPELFAVGAGSTTPGVFDDWIAVEGLPMVLPQATGIVVNNAVAMGAAGAGNLFVAIDGYRFAA